MKFYESIAIILFGSALMVTLPGCDNDDAMENAGEKVDESVEDAGDAVEDATDGN